MIVNWFLNTIDTGIWVFIGLCAWTVAYFIYKWAVKKNHNLSHSTKKGESHTNRAIYNELISVRALTEADRVYITRFHNGNEFLPSHPIWKLTRTHEIVSPGITYESPKYQSLLVSLLSEIIYPIIMGNSEEPGIEVLDCGNCPSKAQCKKSNHHVVLINVDKMGESYCKAFLKEQHIEQSLLCSLEKNNNVIGYFGMDFCGKSLNDGKLEFTRTTIIPNITKIKYILNQE